MNPASSVRGPKYVVKKGKTPVLTAGEARTLLDTIQGKNVEELRDRALIAIMVFSFARVGAVVGMNVEDLRLQRLIQGILVRNYVDTQKLDIQVIGHSAYIEGEFKVFEYHPSQKKEDRIERDLGVKRVIMHVEQQIRGMGEITFPASPDELPYRHPVTHINK